MASHGGPGGREPTAGQRAIIRDAPGRRVRAPFSGPTLARWQRARARPARPPRSLWFHWRSVIRPAALPGTGSRRKALVPERKTGSPLWQRARRGRSLPKWRYPAGWFDHDAPDRHKGHEGGAKNVIAWVRLWNRPAPDTRL